MRTDQYYSIIPEDVLDAEISDGAYRVYGALARIVRTDRTGYGRIGDIAARLRKSESSVRRHIAELVKAELILSQAQWTDDDGGYSVTPHPGWRQTMNRYTLTSGIKRGGDIEPADPPVRSARGEGVTGAIRSKTHTSQSPSIARPSQAMSMNVARTILADHPTDSSEEDLPPADRADPIGPAWRRSPERSQMVQAVRAYAKVHHSFSGKGMDGIDEWLNEKQPIEDWFDHALETVLGADGGGVFSAAASDRSWAPPKRVIGSNLEAGIWLNTFLHWLQGSDGYAGQALTYTSRAA